jgi:hypothetical protein
VGEKIAFMVKIFSQAGKKRCFEGDFERKDFIIWINFSTKWKKIVIGGYFFSPNRCPDNTDFKR